MYDVWKPKLFLENFETLRMLMTHQGLNTTPDQSMRLDFISDEDTVLRPTSGEDGIRSEEDKEDDIEVA